MNKNMIKHKQQLKSSLIIAHDIVDDLVAKVEKYVEEKEIEKYRIQFGTKNITKV
jgi:hypothetical protein